MSTRPRSSSSTSPLLVSLLALSALIAFAWFLAARGYWEDDAYIHLEFARSLASGHGFQFNGHQVYGDSSPLWVFLLVAFHLAFPGWVAAGKTLTVAAAAFALAGVYQFAEALVSSGVRPALPPTQARRFAAFMLLGFVLQPYFGYWAFSGMEALCAAGLAAWTLVLIARHRHSWRRLLVAALLAGLSPLLRPEMSCFALLVAVLLFLRIRRLHAAASHPLTLAQRVDVLVASIVLLVAPSVAWGLYAVHTFGRLLPNTNAAKRAAPWDSVPARLAHVYGFGYPVTVIAFLLLAGWLLWYVLRGRSQGVVSPWRSLHPAGWLVLLWTLLTAIFYLANHTFVQTRYVFVTAPLLTIVLLAMALLRWPVLYRGLLTVTLLFGALVSALTTAPLVHNKVLIDAITTDLAAYLRTLPPNAPVAMYAIGQLAFLSQHPIVDTGGITRPGVLPFLYDPNVPAFTDWLRSQGTQYEVIDHSPLPGSRLLWSREAPNTGWSFDSRNYRSVGRIEIWQLPPAPAW